MRRRVAGRARGRRQALGLLTDGPVSVHDAQRPAPRRRWRVGLVLAGATTLLVGAGVVTAVGAQAAAGCRVAYSAPSSWAGGFTASVDVTNLGEAVNGWSLVWTLPAGQKVTQAWNATVAQSGSQVTATSAGYNAALATNATVSFGFNGSLSGGNPAPTSFVLNGVACTGAAPTAAALPTGSAPNPPATRLPQATQAAAPFKGVANASCDDLDRLKVTWWYNWYIDNGGCHKGGEYVPMISGKGDPAWQVDQIKNAGYKTFLGFNEPDHADQANMSVDKAISLWPKLTELVPGTQQQGYRLGSPAVSGDQGGLNWITAFMNQVQAKGLRVDFLTMHWYGSNQASCNVSGLEKRIHDLEVLPGNRPIWVTEFGCLNMNAQDPHAMDTVNGFYTAALGVFAAHPRVERYAWFPWADANHLVGSDGLTELGTAFASAAGTRDSASGGVTFVNRATGKCLDVAQSSTDNGANVQQWSCQGGPNQRWRIEPQGDGTSRIMNVGSNKALDVADCGTADGTNIEQFDWWNNGCQRWQLVDTGGGWVRLLNPNSGKVADVADCNAADGTNVRLWTWLSNNCQQWQAQ